MKKHGIMICVLVLAILVGCHRKEPEQSITPEIQEPAAEENVPPVSDSAVKELCIEISRGTQSADQLSKAIKELPGRFRTHLEAAGVQVETVRVTVGASAEATMQALTDGSIDIAFLPAENFCEYASDAEALFVDAGEDGVAGARALICAAPTEYGRELARRAGSGKPLSWKEISRARWGLVGTGASIEQYGFELWLYDGYEGKYIDDLAHITTYKNYEELFRAAADGKIDALVIPDDERSTMAEQWVMPVGQAGEGAVSGFGRTESIWNELSALETTKRICRTVVAVAPESGDISREVLKEALGNAFKNISEDASLMSVLGAERFVFSQKGDLDTVYQGIQ